MQDRRQICFILALVGGIFALGTGAMTLLMGGVILSTVPMMPMMDMGGMMLAVFGWLGLTSLIGGVVMIMGALRIRGASVRSGAMFAVVGGGIAVLGGNLLAAALGIVGGALILTEPTG